MPETNHGQASGTQGDSPNIESLAKLCSAGAVPIPDDLPQEQQKELLLKIAKLRRKRLLNLFASAIADEIWRERQATGNPK